MELLPSLLKTRILDGALGSMGAWRLRSIAG
jgi:hypothetical protein